MRPNLIFLWMLLLPLKAVAADIPCRLSEYRVETRSRIAVDCGKIISRITGTASVYVVVNGSVTGAAVSNGNLSVQDSLFLIIDLATELQGNTNYELVLNGSAGAPSKAFDESRFRFSTKANGNLALPVRANPTSLRYGRELWIESTNELLRPRNDKLTLLSQDEPGVFLPHKATTDVDRTTFYSYGTIRLTFADGQEPKQLNANMKVDGVQDIFGQPVPVKWQKRAAPASSPKTKDDAYYYAKLLHQVGINSKPAFILDGKAAPVFPIVPWGNIELRPSATADIGQGGAIGKTKTNDLIQFGVGAGRFLRTERLGALQGVDPTVGFVYETNYELVHKNALFAGEAQWFIAGTDDSLKQKNFIRYVIAKKADPNLQPQDAKKAFFGYRFRFYTGIETGSQISEETAKASSGTSKVQVPKYSIARIYAKASLALDFSQRFTLTLSGTDRYLFTTENVYRERDVPSTTGGDPTKQVYLTTVSGFRPSGEVGLAFAFDDAGHYALSSSVKVGSLPPNFVRVATVQTGLTIKF